MYSMIHYILILLALLSYFIYYNNTVERFLSTKMKKKTKLQKKYNRLETTEFKKTPVSKSFITSKFFQGAKPGYVFKNDLKGIGYYLDSK